MKYKLYRAIDGFDNTDSYFLLREDGFVAISYWNEYGQEENCIKNCKIYSYSENERFNDALNPVLIAEFEV